MGVEMLQQKERLKCNKLQSATNKKTITAMP